VSRREKEAALNGSVVSALTHLKYFVFYMDFFLKSCVQSRVLRFHLIAAKLKSFKVASQLSRNR
jgi:hypothetical protein